jgi:hypothetical protein
LAPLVNKNRTQDKPVRPIPTTTIFLLAKVTFFTFIYASLT